MKQKKSTFNDIVRVMARLRSLKGCPWDRVQTHKSLLKYLKEETKEMAVAIKKKDMENLEEELGDVLLQVLFHSQIAKEKGDFDIYDVITTLKQKLVNRHPHVFSKNGQKNIRTPNDVRQQWKELKKKGQTSS